MDKKTSAPRVFLPKTVAEALQKTVDEPQATFWAGGTWIARTTPDDENLNLPSPLISLGRVEELARASRSENVLEIGSMMTLDRLSSLGKRALPPGLSEALAQVGNYPLRCRATIGGHLAVCERLGDLWPILQLLETQVEIRFLRDRRGRRKPSTSIKRLPLTRLRMEAHDGLKRGELLTKLRIPTERWDHGTFIKLLPEGSGSSRSLVFTALARVEKNVLVDYRMALSDGDGRILRNRDMEVTLAGRDLPLAPKERDLLGNAIDSLTEPWTDRPYERSVAQNLTLDFLDGVSS